MSDQESNLAKQLAIAICDVFGRDSIKPMPYPEMSAVILDAGLRQQLAEARIHRENLLRCCKALVRHEVISAGRAREVCGVSADYWREFVRGCPAINEKVSGYIEELPSKKEQPQ